MSKVQTDQTFTHVDKNLIHRVIVWMSCQSWRKHETCRVYNIPWNITGLRNKAIFCWFTQQKSLRLSWKHFVRWRDLRNDLHMKTDKELESVLGICAVQFHLVLLMKRYTSTTSCIVALSDIQILSWIRACTCDFLGINRQLILVSCF